MDWFRGPPCEYENCRATRYVERADGRTYCTRGHQVEGQFATQVEDFEIGGSQLQGAKRTRKKRVPKEKATVGLSGREAADLYLETFQLVLWKQVAWLVRERGIDPEFEGVVRDLWTLRVEMCKDLLLEKEVDAQQLFSTRTTDDDSEDEPRRRGYARRATFHEKLPGLIETLGLCYMGFVMLRMPICAADVRGWVLNENFAYLRALQNVPVVMRQRLPRALRMGLESRTGLGDLEKLHTTTHDLAFAFHKVHGMVIPPIAYKLLLIKLMVELALPLPIFPAVCRLADLLGLEFSFPTSLLRTIKLSHHPETLLTTLLTVTVKLLHPFDTAIRHPTSVAEPAALVIDWNAWNEIRLSPSNDTGSTAPYSKRSREDFLDITEDDILAMSGTDVDKYLEWFGSNWTQEEAMEIGAEAEFRQEMYRMFPAIKVNGPGVEKGGERSTIDGGPPEQIEVLRKCQAALITRAVLPEISGEGGEILRPGARYRQYRRMEDVPEHAKPFLRAVSELVGMEMGPFIVALFQVERKIQKWSDLERKKPETPNEDRSGSEEARNDPMDVDL